MKILKVGSRPRRGMVVLWFFFSFLVLFTPAKAAFEKEFVWKSFGEYETLAVRLPPSLEMHYSSKPRHYQYGNYLLEDPGFELSGKLAQAFEDRAKDEDLGEWQVLNMVVDFVQSLEYQTETGEYPKYPVETLMDGGGDCEDTSILLAAILDKLGIDCIMLSPPGHMAVGVAVEGLASEVKHYPYNDHKYYYVETTGANWKIGAIPPAHAGTAKIYALPAPARLRHIAVADSEEVDEPDLEIGEVTNLMVAFYRASIGEEDAATKKPLYRYHVQLEAEEDVLQEIIEVQYRFMDKTGAPDPSVPWMRADDSKLNFSKEWVAADYLPLQVRIYFEDGSLVQTVIEFRSGTFGR